MYQNYLKLSQRIIIIKMISNHCPKINTRTTGTTLKKHDIILLYQKYLKFLYFSKFELICRFLGDVLVLPKLLEPLELAVILSNLPIWRKVSSVCIEELPEFLQRPQNNQRKNPKHAELKLPQRLQLP